MEHYFLTSQNILTRYNPAEQSCYCQIEELNKKTPEKLEHFPLRNSVLSQSKCVPRPSNICKIIHGEKSKHSELTFLSHSKTDDNFIFAYYFDECHLD